MGITRAPQTGIPLIIERTILQIQMANEGPNLRIMPINDGMDAHEIGPSAIGAVEMRELRSVRIRPARAHEDGLDAGISVQVVLEARPQGGVRGVRRVFHDVEMVCARGPPHEVFYCWKGIGGQGVD